MSPSRAKFITLREGGMKGAFFLAASFSLLSLCAIIVYLFVSSVPFLNKVGWGNFLFGMEYAPLGENPSYGIFPMIVTTLLLTLLSLILGGGVGFLCAVALFRFLPAAMVKPTKWLIDLLAGIPSVIFGLFGITFIVPFVRDYLSTNGVGYGLLSSSLILSIMILPTMVSVTYDALNAVNPMYYEGALALGSSKEMATFKIVVPASKNGIFAALVLSTGRAMGETMAVIMVLGNSPQMPTSLTQSVRTLTSNIALSATEMRGDAKLALVATGVVLFVFALLVNLTFSLIKGRNKQHV